MKVRLKGAFDYCDGVYSGFTDSHLNDPADFFGFKTNKMFLLTQVGNHDALHYGNIVTYLRLDGLVPSGGLVLIRPALVVAVIGCVIMIPAAGQEKVQSTDRTVGAKKRWARRD